MNRLTYPQFYEIIYLEADINYTIFHLKNGKKIMSSTTLKRHANNLNLDSFLRVNKSYLINPDFIDSIEKDRKNASVIMANGQQLKVSRRKRGMIEKLATIA